MTKISVITAVDRADNLLEAYRSLVKQSIDEWEWVLVQLGAARLPDEIVSNPKVIVSERQIGNGLAFAKRRAVDTATGELVLDLDQDDALALPDSLARLSDGDPSAVRYGAFQPALGDTLPAEYDSSLGWEHFTHLPLGSGRVVRPFAPDASSLHLSEFAPKHGLLWPRKAYVALGGHRSETQSETDFDLACRAYISGLAFAVVDAPTVVTRRRAHVPSDGQLAQQLSNHYVYDLVKAWCRRNNLEMLDLGAAHNPAPGFTSVDLHDAEINCDIRFGLPLADSSVGAIRAQDFLEHMNRCPDSTCRHGTDGGPRCAVGVMNEFYRVLAPGGWLLSGTPSSDGRGAYQDPTHVSFWNPNSFWYYTRREQARFVPGITCRFQGTRIWQTFPNDWHREHNIPYVYADLVALKGQRQAGRCEI